ncbi:hypothetical protein CesoFtcFv8_027854 [Champsocephalus esox]|uniref:Leucine-rich repeat-containing protein 3 n=1 Tax=Champsocephalus esox TaxID=159716 RepID=A0AAN8AZ68_9TELE|nr:hypothetical protein CesoFtcFv8_027854 [Champsocephalus esox]
MGASHRCRSSIKPDSCSSRSFVGTLWLLSGIMTAYACPKICHCTDRNGVVMQCTSRNLENIPLNLPKDTVVLLLSSNRIRHIPKETFTELHRLRELDLSHNAIESVEQPPQGHLRKAPRRVRLSHNPWHCECSLQEVLRELRLDPETVNEVSCSTSVQEEYVGRPVIQVLDSGINFCNFHHKTTDVAMFVAMFCWFSMVTAYIVYYIKHNQEDARRHMEYLKSLPSTSHVSKDYDTASSMF